MARDAAEGLDVVCRGGPDRVDDGVGREAAGAAADLQGQAQARVADVPTEPGPVTVTLAICTTFSTTAPTFATTCSATIPSAMKTAAT